MAKRFYTDIDLKGNKVNNVAPGSSPNDAITKSQLDELESTTNSNITYKGSFDASIGDFSSISPGLIGDMYEVTVGGTIGALVMQAGDYIIVNSSANPVLEANVGLVDNTEAADLVRIDEAQVITNKTIDAETNSITNIDTTEFKAGVLVNTVANDSNTTIATEGAVKSYVATQISATRYSVDVGNGTDRAFNVTHGLATADVSVSIVENASGEIVEAITKIVDSLTVQVDFGDYTPVSAEFKIIIVA